MLVNSLVLPENVVGRLHVCNLVGAVCRLERLRLGCPLALSELLLSHSKLLYFLLCEVQITLPLLQLLAQLLDLLLLEVGLLSEQFDGLLIPIFQLHLEHFAPSDYHLMLSILNCLLLHERNPLRLDFLPLQSNLRMQTLQR